MTDKKLVSIVIPTRNAALTLGACLTSLKSQSYSNLEIVITDNYSLDETRDIGKKSGARIIVCGPPPPDNRFFTAPIQRKIGAEYASGDFLFFVDADMVLESELVEECIEKCSEEEADAVAIPEISFGEGFWSRCKILERACYFCHKIDENIQAARFVERTAYESVGGWEEDVGGFDDWDITARLKAQGYKISYTSHRIFHNERQLTVRRIVSKKYNIGKGVSFSKYLSKSREASFKRITIQLTPLRILVLLSRLASFSKNISDMLGVIFMKMIEGAAFFLGCFVSTLERKRRQVD